MNVTETEPTLSEQQQQPPLHIRSCCGRGVLGQSLLLRGLGGEAAGAGAEHCCQSIPQDHAWGKASSRAWLWAGVGTGWVQPCSARRAELRARPPCKPPVLPSLLLLSQGAVCSAWL